MQDCLGVVGGMTQAAAHAVAAAGSDAHVWCQPLCAALDQLAAQPARSQQLAQLSAALRIVDSSSVCNILVDRASADQNPELSTVSQACSTSHEQNMCLPSVGHSRVHGVLRLTCGDCLVCWQ